MGYPWGKGTLRLRFWLGSPEVARNLAICAIYLCTIWTGIDVFAQIKVIRAAEPEGGMCTVSWVPGRDGWQWLFWLRSGRRLGYRQHGRTTWMLSALREKTLLVRTRSIMWLEVVLKPHTRVLCPKGFPRGSLETDDMDWLCVLMVQPTTSSPMSRPSGFCLTYKLQSYLIRAWTLPSSSFGCW